RSLVPQKPYDVRSANGQSWLCFGAADGGFGVSGQIAPPSGADHRYYVTNASAVSGATTLSFATPTGVVAGMSVFGPQIASSPTVVSVAGSIVTLSNPTTAAVANGQGTVFATPHFDGGLYWVCIQASDTSAASVNYTGFSLSSVHNATLDVVVNN